MVVGSPDDATVGAANKYIGFGNSFSDTLAVLRAYRLGRIQEMRACFKKCERLPTHPNKCTFIQQYFAKKNSDYLTKTGLAIIGTGKRLFPSPKLPVHTKPSLDRLPGSTETGSRPEVRNEWSGASTPSYVFISFARMRPYVSPGVHVDQYKRGVTWIYVYI